MVGRGCASESHHAGVSLELEVLTMAVGVPPESDVGGWVGGFLGELNVAPVKASSALERDVLRPLLVDVRGETRLEAP